MEASTEDRGTGRVLITLAILLAGLNLRPLITSVGPVLLDIQADLGITASTASLLTALPIACFGSGAWLANWVARRLGTERGMTVALAALACGLGLRLNAFALSLLAGTFVAGVAVAVLTVLLPVVIKREFSERTGLMMGAFISVMLSGAALAAWATVPVTARWFGVAGREDSASGSSLRCSPLSHGCGLLLDRGMGKPPSRKSGGLEHCCATGWLGLSHCSSLSSRSYSSQSCHGCRPSTAGQGSLRFAVATCCSPCSLSGSRCRSSRRASRPALGTREGGRSPRP